MTAFFVGGILSIFTPFFAAALIYLNRRITQLEQDNQTLNEWFIHLENTIELDTIEYDEGARE